LAADYGYRPSNENILAEYGDKFKLDIKLYTIDDYGGWDTVYEKFFDDETIFDEIMDY
jgi:sulfate transport system substrate-binding protein